MGIVLSRNLKQKQSIKLTPSLKKSIDLLQLSRFELIKKIENEIIENPFLEKQDYDYDNSYNEKDFNFDIESKLTLRETLLDQLNDFTTSLIPYYFKSKCFYLTRKMSFNALATIIRQICKKNNIRYVSKIKYIGSDYNILYYIYY